MIARVLTIAFNTYREAVRARVLIGLAGVAFAVAFYSLVVGAFTLTEAQRVVADLGSGAISVFSIWIFGGIVYVLSDKTKANRKPIEASAPST